MKLKSRFGVLYEEEFGGYPFFEMQSEIICPKCGTVVEWDSQEINVLDESFQDITCPNCLLNLEVSPFTTVAFDIRALRGNWED